MGASVISDPKKSRIEVGKHRTTLQKYRKNSFNGSKNVSLFENNNTNTNRTPNKVMHQLDRSSKKSTYTNGTLLNTLLNTDKRVFDCQVRLVDIFSCDTSYEVLKCWR